jgi:YfiH family protein
MRAMLSSSLLEAHGIAHGFWGRRGGVSQGVFSSLNCGYGSDDDPALVRENRGIVAAELGVDVDSLVTAYQIHSADVVEVTTPWTRQHAPRGDAMVTTVRGVGLGVLAADCAPVLLADPQAGVIGCAHAGWQGAFKGIIEAVVKGMTRLGAHRAGMVAVVGPCIRQSSYEVGPEFHARFLEAQPMLERFFVPSARDGHWMFDLPAFVLQRLADADVGSFAALEHCTYADEDGYFSFRRTTHRGETHYGRNLSAIVLEP